MPPDPATRATPPLLKDLNERTVLETLRADAPISRAEISRRVGISKPTVSLALQSLLDAGLVREAEHDPDGPSFGAVFFEPVPDAALVLGLDLGARFARGAVCDLTGDIRVRQDVELTGSGADAALAAISAVAASLVAATGSPRELIGRAVVGVPGVVDDRGRLHLTHFRSLEGVDLGRDLSARLGLDVTLVNDINLAALGEEWQGVARGVDDFAFLSVGTGLGIGLVLGGELHTGRNGAAGEIDYALLGFGGGFDPSAVGVSACAAELAEARAVPTTMAPPYEPREIFAAARRGDVLARGGRRRGCTSHCTAHRARRSRGRRRARRPRRRDRRQRRPVAGARPRSARHLAAVSAEARDLEPGGGGRAVRRARRRAPDGTRRGLRQQSPHGTRVTVRDFVALSHKVRHTGGTSDTSRLAAASTASAPASSKRRRAVAPSANVPATSAILTPRVAP